MKSSEQIAIEFLNKQGFQSELLIESIVSLLVQYPDYYNDMHCADILANNHEVRDRLKEIAAKMVKTVIDVDDVVENTAIIISAPTGIFYSAQCDGVACSHPEYEGYAMPFGHFGQNLDDCSFGCSYLSRPGFEDERKKLADAIDRNAINYSEDMTMKVRFDYSRLDELKEGWWPMLLDGKFFDNQYTNHPVIVCAGSCD